MPGEWVIDASVAAKWLLEEEGSEAARRLAEGGPIFIAPDLIYAEIASVISKWVKRGAPEELGAVAVATLNEVLAETVPVAVLGTAPFDLAVRYGFSAHDACYLALAWRRGLRLVTADRKLAMRAETCGFPGLTQLLQPAS
jgi:predicted nucleic acid-binding protein